MRDKTLPGHWPGFLREDADAVGGGALIAEWQICARVKTQTPAGASSPASTGMLERMADRLAMPLLWLVAPSQGLARGQYPIGSASASMGGLEKGDARHKVRTLHHPCLPGSVSAPAHGILWSATDIQQACGEHDICPASSIAIGTRYSFMQIAHAAGLPIGIIIRNGAAQLSCFRTRHGFLQWQTPCLGAVLQQLDRLTATSSTSLQPQKHAS